MVSASVVRSGVVGLAMLLLAGACDPTPPRDLGELVVQDSVYVEPSTGVPWSGPVYRSFSDDPAQLQLEGRLLDGEWDGELRVYHPNGRIRYMGSFARGQQCGAWTQNADSVPTLSLYEEVVREIETLGLYPPCDPDTP